MKEQSGIFAGDGGYTIDIAGHSHLEGGLVTSTRQAESQGLNRFKTGTLSYGDIANHANYRGSAMSMDGQITLDGQGGPKKIGNQQLLDVAKYAGGSQRALGVGQTRDSQQSTTRSGINTANLEITDMARQQMQLNYQTAPAIQMNSGITVGNPHPVKRDNPVSLQAHLAGIKTDTDTQTVAQQAQALTNRFDKDKVQRELDFQVNTTKQFGQTLAEAKRQTKAHLLTNASEQTKQYVDWAFDTIGAGLTTGSVQAAGVAAVSPFVNRTIKQLTTDRQTGETNLVTNTLAHAALGALEAKATGNNVAAGAMAGAGGELAAHFAAKAYGVDGKTKTTQDLTEREKATVKTLGQLGGMVAGGLIGDNSQSAVSSMQIAKRAVENNFFDQAYKSRDYANGLVANAIVQTQLSEATRRAAEEFEKAHPELVKNLRTTGDVGAFLADFTPIIGDIKSFVEAENGIDYALATVGLIPGADVVTKPLKEAKNALNMAKAAEKAGNVAEAIKHQKEAIKQFESVKALDVDSYKVLKARSVVGDNLDLDHIPSFAALKKEKENKLGRKLSPIEEKTLRDEATAIAVPKDTHVNSRTYGGKNTKSQIVNDASNLCYAQECDINHMRKSLVDKGYDSLAVEEAIKEIIIRNESRGIK